MSYYTVMQYSKLMMTDVVVDCELECGLTLSMLPVDYDNYMEWKNTLLFYMNVEKEGIVLWKAA